jgi:histidyl-tRNA synthetase
MAKKTASKSKQKNGKNSSSKKATPKKSVAKKMVKKAEKSVKKPVAKKTVSTADADKRPATEKELLLQSLRGMRDILPDEQPYWERVRRSLTGAAHQFGFQRIDVPTVEYLHLFVRSIREGTDIVDKELYAFETRGGDRVALRPEFTAGVARAYIQHGMSVLPKPVRLFSMGPVFRYDRPQEGRYRELWQGNFDIFGEEDPILDAQLIQIASRVVSELGLKDIEFQVNSIGSPESRKKYEKALARFLESQKQKLCQDCRDRLDKNPLRVLDCKEDKCAQLTASAPQIIDFLDDESRDHFKMLLEYLDELEIPYSINPRLVRGLDYYTRTVFEIWSSDREGKKYALGGGGRYDNLIRELGGEPTPAIGFGLGLDRIVLEMKRTQVRPYEAPKPRVFIAQLGDLAKKKSLPLFADLEKHGILSSESFGRGSLKSQLRAANRIGAEVTVILGQKEALDDTAIVKDMLSGTQETVTRPKLVEAVKKILKANAQMAKKK